ncbi:MAG: BrnT family toxin [Terriglobia bacterium]
MRYEWDEAKRQSNIQKHGIDFGGIEKAFAGTTLTILDDRFDYGETRFITLGLLSGRVVVIAHTETQRVIRIISVRKATKNEEASYFKEIAH